jgi:hypothetical protein
MFRTLVSFTAGIYVAQSFRDQVPDITRIVDGVGQDIQSKLAEYNRRDQPSSAVEYNKPIAKDITNLAMPSQPVVAQPTIVQTQGSSGCYWWWSGPRK